MHDLRVANLVLAFAIELAMLAAFAVAGWASTPILWLRIALTIGFPALAILLWAVWAAPKAGKHRLQMPALLVFKVLMFAGATGALVLAGQGFLAAIFGTLAAVHLLAAVAFGQV